MIPKVETYSRQTLYNHSSRLHQSTQHTFVYISKDRAAEPEIFARSGTSLSRVDNSNVVNNARLIRIVHDNSNIINLVLSHAGEGEQSRLRRFKSSVVAECGRWVFSDSKHHLATVKCEQR